MVPHAAIPEILVTDSWTVHFDFLGNQYIRISDLGTPFRMNEERLAVSLGALMGQAHDVARSTLLSGQGALLMNPLIYVGDAAGRLSVGDLTNADFLLSGLTIHETFSNPTFPGPIYQDVYQFYFDVEADALERCQKNR